MGFLDKAKQRAQDAQRKLDESGALDKAKQAAQQAQQKIDEKQQEINRRQSESPQGAVGQAVRYDQHGRPIREEAPPAGTEPPPGGEETPPAGTAPPPSGEPAEPEPGTPPREDVNRSPDPFRPIQ